MSSELPPPPPGPPGPAVPPPPPPPGRPLTPINGWLVAVGVVLGVFLLPVVTVISAALTYAAGDDQGQWIPWFIGLLVLAPVVALFFRRFRHFASGLLMGMAIGFIAFAGVCFGGLPLLAG